MPRDAPLDRVADNGGVSTSGPDVRSRSSSVATPVLGLLAVMWVAELIDAVLPLTLDQWGVQGRTASGLVGVVLSPFLHGGFPHLIANTVPFLVLGLLVAWRSQERFWSVITMIAVVGGLGVWLLTSPATITIGASGVVFGMAAYLVTAGVLTRHWLDIAVAVGVVLVYGTMFAGVLPFGVAAGVSWLAHLTGALAGVWAAFAFARR
jgi:membrane associated rhomboid family serine protease